jgi:hypothetical protein
MTDDVWLAHSWDCEDVIASGYPCICGSQERLELYSSKAVIRELEAAADSLRAFGVKDLIEERIRRIKGE